MKKFFNSINLSESCLETIALNLQEKKDTQLVDFFEEIVLLRKSNIEFGASNYVTMHDSFAIQHIKEGWIVIKLKENSKNGKILNVKNYFQAFNGKLKESKTVRENFILHKLDTRAVVELKFKTQSMVLAKDKEFLLLPVSVRNIVSEIGSKKSKGREIYFIAPQELVSRQCIQFDLNNGTKGDSKIKFDKILSK